VDSAPHRIVGYNIASVDPDEQRALGRARTGLEWIGDPEWTPHIAPLPFAEEFAALRRESASRAEFAQRLPDAWVHRLAVTGTPRDARERLAELHRSGVTDSVLLPVGNDPLDELEQLAALLR
jgi:alkanesulfonate monooxygenase SsuD/methylene tetrahydromethanopterin reductase-like flavin-dependent oxidoreductase (luciferase family)